MRIEIPYFLMARLLEFELRTFGLVTSQEQE